MFAVLLTIERVQMEQDLFHSLIWYLSLPLQTQRVQCLYDMLHLETHQSLFERSHTSPWVLSGILSHISWIPLNKYGFFIILVYGRHHEETETVCTTGCHSSYKIYSLEVIQPGGVIIRPDDSLKKAAHTIMDPSLCSTDDTNTVGWKRHLAHGKRKQACV